MKQLINANILENIEVIKNIYKLKVTADIEAQPGQFVQVKLPSDDFTLRRPLGIASINDSQLTMFYRIVGRGTTFLSTLSAGDEVNLLVQLGNGFKIIEGKTLLVGGGLGLAPLMFAASKSKSADILMGGRNADETNYWQSEFKSLTNRIFITTDDGSAGSYGFVTDLLPDILKDNAYDLILTCGPDVMMRKVASIAKEHNIKCQVSLEKRMACGLGSCLSCSVDTIHGRRKVCKDGPIFNAEEIYN